MDQNKWIALARAIKYPSEYAINEGLVKVVNQKVLSGALLLPLTATNIYETQKINDPVRRHELAFVQAHFSQGLVFRGRHARLREEIKGVLRSAHNMPASRPDEYWFLSKVFFEAFLERDDKRLGYVIPEVVMNSIEGNPSQSLYSYLTDLPDAIRIEAVRNWSNGSDDLRKRIEKRRRLHAGESIAMRRRIYSALLLIDEFNVVISAANELGMVWRDAADIGRKCALMIANDVHAFHIERELALRLESQPNAICENDFRDMTSFCAVIPYANEVIGEKTFVNMAIQAGLGTKYQTKMSVNIDRLLDV